MYRALCFQKGDPAKHGGVGTDMWCMRFVHEISYVCSMMLPLLIIWLHSNRDTCVAFHLLNRRLRSCGSMGGGNAGSGTAEMLLNLLFNTETLA